MPFTTTEIQQSFNEETRRNRPVTRPTQAVAFDAEAEAAARKLAQQERAKRNGVR